MKLNEKLNAVSSKETLAMFVQDLRQNLLTSPDEWESTRLESFLEALSAWITDMDGYYINQGILPPEQPTWKTVAEMLLAAKTYE
ncbi:DUF7660 family protein [Paraherbaspirillum soli]|uniref:DUF7660 domain-containing protein n=1 Tax=Paraherbaspirillum soli TaxID=631222 RepID=A0ABW0M8W8_9BURK